MGKDSELLHAVKLCDVSAIRKFLLKFKSGAKGKKSISKKLNINHPDEDGFTVLHHAALLNNVEVILALIEMEADPNSRDKKGMCPLHMASWAGKDQIVKALLDNRAIVNLPSFGGETPLLLASQHGYANVVEVLMKYNADPTIRNNNLESPLDLACQFGHAAVVRFLLMRGEVVHMLREKHSDPRYKQPLHLAAKGGHVDVIRLLTESGADINEQSPQGTCLHLAALYGKVEVVKFLIEAGANVRAVNKKEMTPLDMVNQFTTSRAGIEIKQILREAVGERVIFARAISDYVNVYDPTGLSFKTGETITVLEQNEDGRWKGSIVDGQEERVGYFPAKSVSLLSNVKETRSLGSLSSSSDSSLNSTASGRDSQGVSRGQGRTMTDSNKPVGVVPVGTYEVLTLAPTQSPEGKKPPNIPRLNSFKKDSKVAPPRRHKTRSQEEVSEEGASSNRSSSIDTSSDSGIHSHSTGVIQETMYDTMTGPPRPLESNIYDPIPSPTVKSPRIYPTNAVPPFEAELREKQAQQQNGIVKPGNYADIDLSRSDIKPPIDSPPKDRSNTVSYTEVYVAENETTTTGENGPRYQSEARQIPQGTNRKLEFRESYENMNLTEELISKFGRTPEEKKSQEYEDMRAQSISPSDEPFPSPPALPLKSPSPAMQPLPEELPPSPPKKIESRLMPRRPECYENVQPRQIVPIHTQNPFENSSLPPQQEAPFPTIPLPSYNPKTLSAHPEYENYRAPGPTMPLHRSNTYENYRPVNEQPQITRAQTVSERPTNVSSNRPVPLPPKVNRKSVQDSTAPASPCPADSVKTPFLSQLDMDSLNEDEKELLSWLIELKLPQYFQNFQAQGFDMVSVRGVTPEDLTEIEITKAGHRKKLLSEITKLGPSNKLPTHKPEDIGAWLSLVGLRIYEENFVEGGFDEMDFIKDLDQSDLQMIEIKKKGHQKKLLLAVQRLSDVELTAELDKVVEVTAQPLTSTAIPEQKQDFSTTHSNDVRASDPPQKSSKQSPPNAVHRNETQTQPEQLPTEFPPPLPPQFPPQPHQQHPPQIHPQHPPQSIQQAPPVPPPQPPVAPKPRVSQPTPQNVLQPPFFPPPPPSSELESHFLCNRDNLPPPSGKESTPLEPIAPTPPRAPIKMTADNPCQVSNPSQSSNPSQPSIRPRTTSVPVAPKPKPKPRPGQNMGQVRTASEYHATDSPSKAVIMPTPVIPQKPTVSPKGDESESVTAARSRDFWQQGHQQQQQQATTTSATNTPVRTKSISGIKPIVSPRPSQKQTAPPAQRPVNQNPEPNLQPGHEVPSQKTSQSPSVKKVPPPAPPRRDSMSHKKDVPTPQRAENDGDVSAAERSRTFSGPLDEKIRDVFRSKGAAHTLEQAPIFEQTLQEFPEPSPPAKAKADEDFEATDMIMADIDDMIADFTNQLDSMF